jgi:hypothetical protein
MNNNALQVLFLMRRYGLAEAHAQALASLVWGLA